MYSAISKKGAKEYFKNSLPKDNINPDHYKVGGIETFDFITAKTSPEQLAGYCKGNILKYVSRADHKNGVEDLKKAKWYLDKLIKTFDD
tara:strand:- start:466 stop:732 length:267 start_codon:yes stop_codon:yes gene_type:complete